MSCERLLCMAQLREHKMSKTRMRMYSNHVALGFLCLILCFIPFPFFCLSFQFLPSLFLTFFPQFSHSLCLLSFPFVFVYFFLSFFILSSYFLVSFCHLSSVLLTLPLFFVLILILSFGPYFIPWIHLLVCCSRMHGSFDSHHCIL